MLATARQGKKDKVWIIQMFCSFMKTKKERKKECLKKEDLKNEPIFRHFKHVFPYRPTNRYRSYIDNNSLLTTNNIYLLNFRHV